MFTTRRINRFLNRIEKVPKDLTSPEFIAEVGSQMITKGAQHPDGTRATVIDVVDGFVMKYGPGLKEDFKKELPRLIPLFLQNDISPTPNELQSPGQALANQRWGGLKAAQGVATAAGKIAPLSKASAYVRDGAEIVKGLVEIKGVYDEYKASSDNGGDAEQAAVDADYTILGRPM